jgi:hypothetical protein
MALETFLKAVGKRARELASARTGIAPDTLIGIQFVGNIASPPRVVLVPKRGPVNVAKTNAGLGVSNPRPLASRALQIDIFVAGKTMDETEGLCGDVLAALADPGPGAQSVTFSPVAEDWGHEVASQLKSGSLCVLTVALSLAYPRPADREVLITGATVTGSMNGHDDEEEE